MIRLVLPEGQLVHQSSMDQGSGTSEPAESAYRLLFESNPNPMWVFDAQTLAFLDVNDAAIRMYGYSRDEFLSMTIANIRPPEDVNNLIDYIIDRPVERHDAGTWKHRTKDGRLLEVEVSSSVIPFGGRPARLVVALDATDRRRAERALSRQATRLEALHSIDRDILSAKSLEEIVAAALSRMRELVACDRATIALFDRSQLQAVLFVVDINGETHLSKGTTIPLDDLEILQALREGNHFQAEDLAGLDDLIAPLETLRTEGLRSFLIQPLMAREELLGSLSVSSKQPGGFTVDELIVVREVADQLAIAIAQSRLREAERERARELEELVTHLRKAHQQERSLLSRLVHAQEEERQRIAMDVHDDSVQVMTAVGMRLAALRRRIGGDSEAGDLVTQLDQTVSRSIERLRRLLFDLHPPALDQPEGLRTVLQESIERLGKEAGARVSFEDRLEHDPPNEIRAICYRIAQEALANVRKHAQASAVSLLVEPRDGGIVVQVRDDGVGFSPIEASVDASAHIGLASMTERAELAGGWCRIDSGAGQGTAVECWLPLAREATSPIPADYAL